QVFVEREVDIAILEVGLGGRLDAVNIWDADVAVITTIALDHTDWLGDTLDDIAYEKSGIARNGHPLVVGQADPVERLLDRAEELGAQAYVQGRDFSISENDKSSWYFHASSGEAVLLPRPSIVGAASLLNAAAAIQAIRCLESLRPVDPEALRQGLPLAVLVGRAHSVEIGGVRCVFDVAHNPQAIGVFIAHLETLPTTGTRRAVAAFMADKAIAEMLTMLKPHFAHWHLGDLPLPRAISADGLRDLLGEQGVTEVHCNANVAQALSQALAVSRPGDCVAVFGSFVTVAETLGQHL
ncbi:MAG: Mur ligase family protein, partial [Pseudomonadota bacterium]